MTEPGDPPGPAAAPAFPGVLPPVEGPAGSKTDGYDPAEVRRRMAVCFSVAELKQLGESLGVSSSVAGDRGPSAAASDIVKQFERYYGLEVLMAKLRELRPLVEWPEPRTDAPAPAPPPVAPTLLGDGGASLGAPSPGAPAPPAKTIADEAPPIRDPLAPPPSAAPRSASPYWPGMAEPPQERAPQRGLDPRILLAVAGLTVLAALIAYAAGRASHPAVATAPAGSDAAAASAAPLPPRRPDGPATHASDALRRSLGNVARLCELPPSAGQDATVIGAALSRCGTPLVRLLPPRPAPDPSDDPTDRPVVPRNKPAPTDTPPPVKKDKPPKDPAATPGAACLTQCDSEKKACYGGCGAEPQQSSLYEGYQLCRTRCLTVASHCRLACPQ